MLIENIQEAADFVRSKTSIKPTVGIVLGSGLGHFVEKIKVDYVVPYSDIPHFTPPTVEGHGGKLLMGEVEGVNIACLQGRVHYYEGHPMHQVVFPVRTLAMLGVETLILTNAAGSMDAKNTPGTFLIIEDHINLMGDNPLKGPNIKHLGPRFPDMTETYDKEILKSMEQVFKDLKIKYAKGIYCGVSGPTYETPAEIKYLQSIGGTAVGMSTVPEAIAANHLGLKIGALSCLTNLAAGLSPNKLTHDEVTETAKKVEEDFSNFLVEFLKRSK